MDLANSLLVPATSPFLVALDNDSSFQQLFLLTVEKQCLLLDLRQKVHAIGPREAQEEGRGNILTLLKEGCWYTPRAVPEIA